MEVAQEEMGGSCGGSGSHSLVQIFTGVARRLLFIDDEKAHLNVVFCS